MDRLQRRLMKDGSIIAIVQVDADICITPLKNMGENNFKIEEIDCASSKEELDEKEKYWINFYSCIAPNGYNLKSGGNHPTYSDESRKRMSLNHADVSGSKNPRFGESLSKDAKMKISRSRIGSTLQEGQRYKIRKNSRLRKPVINIDTNETFLSTREAEEAYKLSHGAVSRVCRGEGKRAGGFKWKYEEVMPFV